MTDSSWTSPEVRYRKGHQSRKTQTNTTFPAIRVLILCNKWVHFVYIAPNEVMPRLSNQMCLANLKSSRQMLKSARKIELTSAITLKLY